MRSKIVLMGLLVAVWQSIPIRAEAAPKAAETSAAQKVLDGCLRQYCGRRLPSIVGSRPIRIENCFRMQIGKYPADWLAYLGIKPSIPVEVIDADLSTVTTQADRVLLVHDTEPWLLHLELQASRDIDFSKRETFAYASETYSRILELSDTRFQFTPPPGVETVEGP